MTFLNDIIKRKRVEIESARQLRTEGELAVAVDHMPSPLVFFDALAARHEPTRIIAEVKRASPSLGTINANLEATEQAQRYAKAHVAAISVLTDGPGFGGSLDDLVEVREAVTVPLLRKDFILERYQMLEARLAGADAILLIVAVVADDLERMLAAATGLGLGAIIEVHDALELQRALDAGARIIGINNRNLHTFEINLSTTEQLLPRIPEAIKVISESGVRTVADAARLRAAGATNLLVGEALVRATNPEELIRSLVNA